MPYNSFRQIFFPGQKKMIGKHQWRSVANVLGWGVFLCISMKARQNVDLMTHMWPPTVSWCWFQVSNFSQVICRQHGLCQMSKIRWTNNKQGHNYTHKILEMWFEKHITTSTNYMYKCFMCVFLFPFFSHNLFCFKVVQVHHPPGKAHGSGPKSLATSIATRSASGRSFGISWTDGSMTYVWPIYLDDFRMISCFIMIQKLFCDVEMYVFLLLLERFLERTHSIQVVTFVLSHHNLKLNHPIRKCLQVRLLHRRRHHIWLILPPQEFCLNKVRTFGLCSFIQTKVYLEPSYSGRKIIVWTIPIYRSDHYNMIFV